MSRIWKAVGTVLAILMWLLPVALVADGLFPRHVAEVVAIVIVELIVACSLAEPLVHPGFLIVPVFGAMFTYEITPIRPSSWLIDCALFWGISAFGCEFLRARLGHVRELKSAKSESE